MKIQIFQRKHADAYLARIGVFMPIWVTSKIETAKLQVLVCRIPASEGSFAVAIYSKDGKHLLNRFNVR